MCLRSLEVNVKPSGKNMDVMFDNEFKFDKQENSAVKCCFFQLKLLSKVKSFLL